MKRLCLEFIILVGILSFGLTGCKRAPELHVTAAPPAVLEGGWLSASSPDGSVTLGIPPGWKAGVDTSAGSLSDMMSNIGGSNTDSQPISDPALNSQLQDMAQKMEQKDKEAEQKALAKLAEKGIVINAINGSKPIPGEERTHFYVKVFHSGGPISKEDAIDIEKNHFAFPPKPTNVQLPIGAALRFAADDSLRDGMTLHQISYVVVDGSDFYTLRFITEEDATAIQQIAEAVANTFRIKPMHKG